MPNRVNRLRWSRRLPWNSRRLAAAGALMGAVLLVSAGCKSTKKPPPQAKVTARYESLPPRQVPDYLKDSILERCDLANNTPMLISGFGLVANLRGTGDTFCGTPVRQYIMNMMIKRGFGSRVLGYENMQPEDILKDPRFSIVRVDGLLPPGAHPHQRFDVYVSALDGNNTASLAHGDLYRADLKVNGANVLAPEYAIDVWATAEGAIFVNPAYALSASSNTAAEARASLRQGTIVGGGIAMMERPLILRVRQPQLSMTRTIEYRIVQAFQDRNVAGARDEALIALRVPEKYGTDWEHFAQVVRHLFLNSSPQFGVLKARQLADQAVKPDAPLLDISYCWEALGPQALPFVTPLMTSDKPEVAFAAARAAAFIGDSSAQDVLMEMARNKHHSFQIPAVQTLGKMPSTPELNHMLRSLLDSEQTLVRVEAYRALAANGDSSIDSRPIVRPNGEESFMLDVVHSQGTPLIYASRTGIPRIAVIGNNPRMNLPVLFSAMENRLTISSEVERQLLTIFYRGPELSAPVSFLTPPDIAEVIGRLGGVGAPGEPRLNFNYCEVVSVLQAMSQQQRLSAAQPGLGGKRIPVAFVLQESPRIEQSIEQAPSIPEQPAAAPVPEKIGSADPGGSSAAAGSGMNPNLVK